ncbi:MAG: hypothetical protein JSV62_16395 [Promethearchaeota archaeon]|nr:MAG: hypothetical protein JSV62_16395 [Candidatus Lokiarchaeota archaeon]
MKKQNYFLKLLIVIAILSTSFIAVVFSNYDVTNISSGNCGSGHNREDITISTNYTGNSVLIDKAGYFDLEVSATGQITGDVWIGYAFWHTGSDGIQLPDTSPFITEDNLVNEWNDGDDYFALFAWQTVVNPMTRTFRINTTSIIGTEILTIQVAGDDTGPTNEKYSNVINFTINIKEEKNPNVIITAPIDNAYVSGSSVAINAIVDDGIGSGVASVLAEITNNTYIEIVNMTGTEPNYTGIWDSTIVEDGEYNITIVAEDNHGNLNNTESISINVNNYYIGPKITIIEPLNADSGFEAPNFTVSFNGAPIDKTWYMIFNGIEWSEPIFFIGTSGTINLALWNSLSIGDLIIRFYVNDTFGNLDYEDVGFVKILEVIEEEQENLQVNDLQMIIISSITGISIIGGVVITGVNIKKRRSSRRFGNDYERDYYEYYGKKPRKRKNAINK